MGLVCKNNTRMPHLCLVHPPNWNQNGPFRIIGAMSGTSLDGLDLCGVEFRKESARWNAQILAFETIPYLGTPWAERLRAAYEGPGALRQQVSLDFAAWCQIQWLDFNQRHKLSCHAIAHHGHTVEHDPARGITVQIGHESALFASSPVPVVGDFRSASVARGGQGAPLVPIADRDLFGEFDVCVNLGGFSNASWTDSEGMRRAGDLGPCNGLLNALASELGLDFDPDGMHAAQGSAADDARLRAIDYYHKPFPKSLGREWMERVFMPEFGAIRPTSTQDALATAAEHIAWTLAYGLRSAGAPPGRVLLSGGGALNADLVRRVANQAPEWSWQVAPGELLQAKEALAFAYLGLLKLRGEPNVLKSYAGGSADGCDGIVFSSVTNI